MDPVHIDLYEFLTESELQQYYNSIKNELKITNAAQFKYATDEDLKQIGLSRPEIRRLRKFHEKYFPHGYLSKIKRLLQAPTTIVKRDDGSPTLSHSSAHSSDPQASAKTASSPNKTPNNKHIIPADSICVNKQLGTGEFGIVQQGVWTNGSERIQVAIKCLCRERMQSNPMEFLKEAAIMHSIEHENIVRLYGVVLATDSLMLVTELAHLRSLLECLKDSGLRVSFLTIPTLCEFAMQICNGMKYLENKRLIHRDLAARNILVFSKNKVKISDFGLSRALGVGKDYYKTNFNVNLKLPIAWCAPECINYLRFTNASDVWAFGVCLWEMFSYGFQPWAALTGLQILEAIDAPNYQRLEQPECCPRDYYQLMIKCWQDDPLKRPKFSEIYEMLPEIKPEQLKTVVNYCEPKKDHLFYRQGDIITVLDRSTNSPYWKGVLSSGKTGLFNPANTVAYLEALPSSNRDSFCRANERCSKRKLRTEMISKPQNDLKHTGHIGIDGDSFGDVAFLANSQNYNHLPRQIVTPYKPSEDIEQTPLLLPPTPTSPDSLQTASSYFPEEVPTSSTNPTFISSNENTPKQIGQFGQSSFDFPGQQLKSQTVSIKSTNPFTNNDLKSQAGSNSFAMQNNNYDLESNAFTNVNMVEDSVGAEGGAAVNVSKRSTTTTSWASSSGSNIEEQHEYHEISDDEIPGDKFDFGPSLLDEINSMFGSISANASSSSHPKSPDFEHMNKKNEIAEFSSKLNRKNSGGDSNGNKTGSSKKKTAGTVKPISVKDEKILNHAIEIANEISARSMTDLVSEPAPSTQSPKRKFSFRFPHLSHHGSHEKSGAGESAGGGATATYSKNGANGNMGTMTSYSKEKKNFTEELKSIPDLQRFRSLSEIENFNKSEFRIPLFDKESSDYCFQKSREILTRPFVLNTQPPSEAFAVAHDRDVLGENIMDIENTLKAINLDFMQNYNELDKTDSAETLLNEKFSNIVSSLEDEISSATGSLKSGVYDYGNGMQTKFDFSAATSHLDKHLQYVNSQAASAAHNNEAAAHDSSKFVDDKRSSTPDTGFASRDTNLSLSRRSSQKSSYSPQDSYFSPKDVSFGGSCYVGLKNETSGYTPERTPDRGVSKYCSSPLKTALNTSNASIHSNHPAGQAPKNGPEQYNSYRQRSMSFTDNYNLKSPVLSEPQPRPVAPQPSPAQVPQRSSGSFRRAARPAEKPVMRHSSYKPRSIRARTLRRLSYNPIVLDSSSSSAEESECDRSIARSECDIRTRVSVSSRRRRQYLNRKVFSASHEDHEAALAKETLYGSNASIRSAPHYNYGGLRSRPAYEASSPRLYDDRIYDFGGRGPGNNYGVATSVHLIKPPKAFAMNGACVGSGSGSSSAASSAVPFGGARNYMFEFDVSKLTGKSPTSHSFFNSSPEDKAHTPKPPSSLPLPLPLPLGGNASARGTSSHAHSQAQAQGGFHWPEKIHASTVKQNDLLWRQQRATQVAPGGGAFGSTLKAIIGEEGREAYNSLIERKSAMILSPAASLLSKLDTNEFELTAARTLPRRSVHLRGEDDALTLALALDESQHQQQLTIPHQNAPRPMTLPTRGAAVKLRKAELLMPAPKLRTAGGVENDENCNLAANGAASDKDSPCESPSYLTNTFGAFSDKPTPTTPPLQSPQTEESCSDSGTNPIPLPPRDGKKHIKTNAKRHVRKYPLIIPAYGVQRTLNKVTEATPMDDDEARGAAPHTGPATDRHLNLLTQAEQKSQSAANLRRFTHEVVAAVRPTARNSATYENTSRLVEDLAQRTYQNLQEVQKTNGNAGVCVEAAPDSASLQFESILEGDFNKADVLQSPDVTDGFYNFSIQKEQYNKCKEVEFSKAKIPGLYVDEDERKNLDIENNLNVAKPASSPPITAPPSVEAAAPLAYAPPVVSESKGAEPGFVAAAPSKPTPAPTAAAKEAPSKAAKDHDNELAGHALFKKVRASVDNAMSHNASNHTAIQPKLNSLSAAPESVDSAAAAPNNAKSEGQQLKTEAEYFSNAAARLKDSNSVSCEDLLEFSDKKPKGCERGVDSDEVRIMMKVLGKDTTPTRCLHVLEFIDWDVHKAIKLIKLQNILASSELSLTASVEALQKYEWDLQITAMKLKGLK